MWHHPIIADKSYQVLLLTLGIFETRNRGRVASFLPLAHSPSLYVQHICCSFFLLSYICCMCSVHRGNYNALFLVKLPHACCTIHILDYSSAFLTLNLKCLQFNRIKLQSSKLALRCSLYNYSYRYASFLPLARSLLRLICSLFLFFFLMHLLHVQRA
jgi:hypothetical protein